MRRVDNIGTETWQRHVILFQETELVLILHYYPTTELWTFDAEYKDFTVYGVGLSVGTLHIESRNQPFDFIVQDTSGNGLDPFRREDFAQGRNVLYLLEPDDIASIRGVEVPV